MSLQEWDTCQKIHMRGIAALREALGILQKERVDLHAALNDN